MQQPLREARPELRESLTNAVRASPDTGLDWRSLAHGLAVAACVGAFLALVDAFGTRLPLLTRLAYWAPLMMLASVVAMAMIRVLLMWRQPSQGPWLFAALATIALTPPITILVWIYSNLFFGGGFEFADLLGSAPGVATISAAMVALWMTIERAGAVTHAAPDGAAAPRFQDRLPNKLRGAEIYAVEAQDHYLRVHTSKGADLILMRLSDAIGELEGIEGAQTHRSWWVARDAVLDTKRAGERVVLALKGGSEAPVSRANVRPLREAGWL